MSTMLPSGGFVGGFDPTAGSNSFVDTQLNDGNITNNPLANHDYSKGALDQLRDLAESDPAYMELYLQLLAERENTSNAQAWYEKMSNSSYQRAADDLRKAGLNPWLALQSLGGAGSGSLQPAGTWSNSAYQNKTNRDQALSNNAKNIIQALGALIGVAAAFAMFLA